MSYEGGIQNACKICGSSGARDCKNCDVGLDLSKAEKIDGSLASTLFNETDSLHLQHHGILLDCCEHSSTYMYPCDSKYLGRSRVLEMVLTVDNI